ncbi:MAG: hypothetical protein IKS62_03900, partial [Aeriscardovia sp.]|nr:hypothetical protein [Aeriscardovia sp.]
LVYLRAGDPAGDNFAEDAVVPVAIALLVRGLRGRIHYDFLLLKGFNKLNTRDFTRFSPFIVPSAGGI